MASEQPMLSVVVPVLDAEDAVAGQLEALAAQEWSLPWEVVVVDNGSTDGTVEVVERFRERLPSLRVVDASERRGQAHALNVGVREARAEAVAFCDADDEVALGWVAGMGEALARSSLVACRSEPAKLNDPWVAATREAQPPGALSTVPFPPFAPYAGSGGLGVRRSVHERLGGFDEEMPVLFDVDYCLRARAQGLELELVPDALLHYRYRTGWLATFKQARVYAEQMALVQKRHEEADQRPPRQRPWLLRGWKPILSSLASLHRREARAKLAWLLGWQLGRCVGSVRYRVLAN
ncbi:MAG TPA: glycosyltransferase [Gaiellaceae bacterium]|nr:glycosyltransferase [Gaiellaceae bacterium]